MDECYRYDLIHCQQAAKHIAIYPSRVVLNLRVDLLCHQWPRNEIVGGGLRSLLPAMPLGRLDCIESFRQSLDCPIYLLSDYVGHYRAGVVLRRNRSSTVDVLEHIGSFGSGLCFVTDADGNNRSSRFRQANTCVVRNSN